MSDPVQAYLEAIEQVYSADRQLEKKYGPETIATLESAIDAARAAYTLVPYDKRIGLRPPPTREDFYWWPL